MNEANINQSAARDAGQTILLHARCRAFRGQLRENTIAVKDGVVRVYDEIAGYYTTCHSLSKRAQNRFLAMSKTR